MSSVPQPVKCSLGVATYLENLELLRQTPMLEVAVAVAVVVEAVVIVVAVAVTLLIKKFG
jgi:hypothetical protein